jgi:CubicO group peptidase (beta-lactamase class C family)
LQIDACFNWIGCSAAKRARAVTLYRADGTVARDDTAAVHGDCTVVPARDGGCALDRYRLGQTGSIFSPQGGLRISAQDLAKVGQVMLRGQSGFLSAASVDRLTRPLWLYNGQNGNSEAGFFCAYSMGLHILSSDNAHPGCAMPFADGTSFIGHAGEAYALTSGLWWSQETGRGVAFFRTQVPDAEAANHCIWPCHISAR